MTALAWTSPVDMTSDATLRAWGSELNAKLVAAGLVQTADTGQINWATVTKGAANAALGYEVWRFSDASIVFKIEYVMGSTTTNLPVLYATVGTGSNGSGAITGQASTRNTFSYTAASITPGSTTYPSYLCHTADFFGLAFKFGVGSGIFHAFLAITKTCDTAGSATTTGFAVYRSQSTGVLAQQVVRTAAAAATRTESTSFSFVQGLVTDSTTPAGDKQRYRHFEHSNGVNPLATMCTYVASEVSTGSSFAAAMVGSTARTFLALGGVLRGEVTGSSNYATAMLYE